MVRVVSVVGWWGDEGGGCGDDVRGHEDVHEQSRESRVHTPASLRGPRPSEQPPCNGGYRLSRVRPCSGQAAYYVLPATIRYLPLTTLFLLLITAHLLLST